MRRSIFSATYYAIIIPGQYPVSLKIGISSTCPFPSTYQIELKPERLLRLLSAKQQPTAYILRLATKQPRNRNPNRSTQPNHLTSRTDRARPPRSRRRKPQIEPGEARIQAYPRGSDRAGGKRRGRSRRLCYSLNPSSTR